MGASARINVLLPGAIASQPSSGATITAAAGHGFRTSDKLMIGTDVGTFSGINSVLSTTSTTFTMTGGTYNVAAGDTILNLGQDTGVTEPNWDGQGLAIYSDPAGTAAITNQEVVANESGGYTYFHSNQGLWEVVRTAAGVPVDVITYADLGRIAVIGNSTAQIYIGTSPMPSGLIADGIEFNKLSTGTRTTSLSWSRDGNNRWGLGEDYYQGDRSYFVPIYSDLGISGTSGDISGVSWYGAEGENVHGGSGGTSSPKWFFNGTPYNNYASSWTYHFLGGSTSGTKRQALFQHGSYTGNDGGIDIFFSGTNNPIELKQEDGSSYRNSIRFYRVTAAGGAVANADWLLGMGVVTGSNTFSIYDQIAADTRYIINSSGSHLWSNANGTYTPTFVFDHLAESAVTNADVTPWALRFRSTGTPAIGLGLYQSFRLPDAAGTEAQGGAVGIKITDATAGALKAQTQLWSSYSTSAVLSVTHARKVLVNTTTETLATALTIGLDADSHAAITLAESTANPTAPSDASSLRFYMKADKAVFQFFDGAAAHYFTLDLTATSDQSLVYSASAP